MRDQEGVVLAVATRVLPNCFEAIETTTQMDLTQVIFESDCKRLVDAWRVRGPVSCSYFDV